MFSRGRISGVIFLVLFFAVSPVMAVQEIKEKMIIGRFLDENEDMCRRIFRTAHDMMREAHPFSSPRHSARYRFAPTDRNSRLVMTLSRNMIMTFRLLQGTLCHAPMIGRDETFKKAYSSLESLGIFGKRALRAIRDGNFSLYLASAQGIEKESFLVDKCLADLEIIINQSIRATDAVKEDL